MLRIVKNAEVYAPQSMGRQDIWVADGRIMYIGTDRTIPAWVVPDDVLDAEGMRVIPGMVDGHVHLTGGGGESGPASRVPRLGLSRLTRAGITSCVGVLGTDGTTRTMRDLVATTLGLRELGMSAWCYTGNYQVPVRTLTGSIRDDITFIDPIIGVGELAISDHRSSQPTLDELLRVASDAYVAGILSNKAGLVHLHLGDGPRGLSLVRQALNTSELPARVFHPTHVNRQRRLFAEAMDMASMGLIVDVTAFPGDEESYSAPEAIDRWLTADLPTNQITCSSDGAGCLPVFDENGRMTSMDIGQPNALTSAMAEVLDMGHDPATVFSIFTQNAATTLGLNGKGSLAIGADADLVVLNEAHQPTTVMAKGQWMVREGQPHLKGPFEKDNQ